MSSALNVDRGGSRLPVITALDGLRGVAILLVVGVNAEWPFMRGGFFGVDMFFVLSGFLIVTLLIREREMTGGISLKRFFLRRALRLMPALVALLAFSCVYTLLFRADEQRAPAFMLALAALFYVSNWVIGVWNVHGTLEHTWSLGVEGQFYLLGATSMAWLHHLNVPPKRIAWLLVVVASGVAIWRGILWSQSPGVMRVYMGLDTRADAILVGCILAYLWEYSLKLKVIPVERSSFQPAKIVGCLCWLLILACAIGTPGVGSSFPYYAGIVLVSLATAVLIAIELAKNLAGERSLLSFPPLAWVGRISYSLYLWHVPLKNVASTERLLPYVHSAVAAELVRLAIFLGFASASYYLIERPILSFKDRFELPKIRQSANG